MKVLIADDDRDLLGLIAFTLTQAGYLVVKASDGPSAIRAFDERIAGPRACSTSTCRARAASRCARPFAPSRAFRS